MVKVRVVAESAIDGHGNVSVNAATVVANCRAEGYRLIRISRRFNRPVRVKIAPQDLRRKAQDSDVYYLAGSLKSAYIHDFFGDDVTVESFITDTLEFQFQQENYKKVPVEVAQRISFRSQYMATGPVKTEPDSVYVYGEPAKIENITSVETGVLHMDDVHSDLAGVLKLTRPGAGVRLSDSGVNYTLPVSRYVEMRQRVPVEVRNAPAGTNLQVFPSEAELVLRCVFPSSGNPFHSLSLYIDYNDFSRSIGGRCVARLSRLPSGVISYSVVPEVFDCIQVQ